MIGWFRKLISRFLGFFKSAPVDVVDRSRLVGMYLDQANQHTGAGTRARTCREREDGRFAQIRQRE